MTFFTSCYSLWLKLYFVLYKYSYCCFLLFSFSLNLLGWHWLTKVYRLQMYSSATYHLCKVLHVHLPRRSLHLPQFIPPTPSSSSSYTATPWHSQPCVCAHEVFLFSSFSLNSSTQLQHSPLSPNRCQLALYL